jgi:hypothetical protein
MMCIEGIVVGQSGITGSERVSDGVVVVAAVEVVVSDVSVTVGRRGRVEDEEMD